MTGMEHAIEKAARVVDGILGADPQISREMRGDEPDRIARALAEDDLLAPAQLTEEFGAQFRGGVRTLPDGYRDVGSHHRYVTDWLPVDLARALLAAAKAATSD